MDLDLIDQLEAELLQDEAVCAVVNAGLWQGEFLPSRAEALQLLNSLPLSEQALHLHFA